MHQLKISSVLITYQYILFLSILSSVHPPRQNKLHFSCAITSWLDGYFSLLNLSSAPVASFLEQVQTAVQEEEPTIEEPTVSYVCTEPTKESASLNQNHLQVVKQERLRRLVKQIQRAQTKLSREALQDLIKSCCLR